MNKKERFTHKELGKVFADSVIMMLGVSLGFALLTFAAAIIHLMISVVIGVKIGIGLIITVMIVIPSVSTGIYWLVNK